MQAKARSASSSSYRKVTLYHIDLGMVLHTVYCTSHIELDAGDAECEEEFKTKSSLSQAPNDTDIGGADFEWRIEAGAISGCKHLARALRCICIAMADDVDAGLSFTRAGPCCDLTQFCTISRDAMQSRLH